MLAKIFCRQLTKKVINWRLVEEANDSQRKITKNCKKVIKLKPY